MGKLIPTVKMEILFFKSLLIPGVSRMKWMRGIIDIRRDWSMLPSEDWASIRS